MSEVELRKKIVDELEHARDGLRHATLLAHSLVKKKNDADARAYILHAEVRALQDLVAGLRARLTTENFHMGIR